MLGGLFLSGFFSKHDENAMWLDGGGSPASQAPTPDNSGDESTPAENTPPPTPGKMAENPRGTPPPESIIVLPTTTPLIVRVTPRPTPTPTPTPQKPTPTPKTPTPVVTPKRTPSPSPTAKKKTPSPSPKASASPKKSASPKPGSPKPSASPSGSATPKAPSGEGANNPQVESGTTAATSGTSSKGPAGTNPAGSGGGHSARDGPKNGAEEAAKVNMYLVMLQKHLYGIWQQPTSILQAGQHLVTTIKIRIEKDGTISNVTLETSSGNSIMDDSVMQAARRLQKIDPLPSSIKDSFYDVPIDIELTPN